MNRIDVLVGEVPVCDILADVGCDHGNLAAACLKTGKAKRVILTDISAPSLEKAKTLLESEIATGTATAVCCDGLKGVASKPDVAVIAGMGGMEIIHILRDMPFFLENLVLSPHKNAPELRTFLVQNGYRILRDYVITDGGKYYDVIACDRGKDQLSELQTQFGKTNLACPSDTFIKRIQEEKESLEIYLQSDLSETSRKKLLQRKKLLEEIGV